MCPFACDLGEPSPDLIHYCPAHVLAYLPGFSRMMDTVTRSPFSIPGEAAITPGMYTGAPRSTASPHFRLMTTSLPPERMERVLLAQMAEGNSR